MVQPVNTIGSGANDNKSVLPHVSIVMRGNKDKAMTMPAGDGYDYPVLKVVNSSYDGDKFFNGINPYNDKNPTAQANRIIISGGAGFALIYNIETGKVVREDSGGKHKDVGTAEFRSIVQKSIDYYKQAGDSATVVMLNRILSVAK